MMAPECLNARSLRATEKTKVSEERRCSRGEPIHEAKPPSWVLEQQPKG